MATWCLVWKLEIDTSSNILYSELNKIWEIYFVWTYAVNFLTTPCSPVDPEEMVGPSTGLASPSLLTGSSMSSSPESAVAPVGPYKVRKSTVITLNFTGSSVQRECKIYTSFHNSLSPNAQSSGIRIKKRKVYVTYYNFNKICHNAWHTIYCLMPGHWICIM